MYQYKAIIYKNPAQLGVADNSHAADKADFEANYKSLATKVTSVILAETTFEIDKTYAQFKALIDGTAYTWADVRYVDDNAKYGMVLLTDNPI